MVETTPIAVCVTCMSVVKPVKVKFIEALGRGWKYYKHEHPLSIVRLKRSGQERSIEYSGEKLPDWLRLSIERMWRDWKIPPEEVAYKTRVLLEAYRLFVKVLRCYGAVGAGSQVRLPIVKSVHEPDWLSNFMWRLYLDIPRARREMCSEG
jgi:hypothetical protein